MTSCAPLQILVHLTRTMDEHEILEIIPGFVLDLRTLMSDWKKKNSTKFCDFKEVWKQLGLSMIHAARPKKIRKERMDNDAVRNSVWVFVCE
jgi:hypothetical protein